MGHRWDDIGHPTAKMEFIDRKAVDYFLHKAVSAKRMPESALRDSTKRVLTNLHLIDDEGHLKNAALLLFGKYPQRYFPGSEFQIGRFVRGVTDLVFQDRVDGNIIQMADTVVGLLRSKYLTTPIHYEGMVRMEPLEIPEEALREAIYNAIVHKDYMGVNIQLRVWNDSIELWNQGKLPDEIPVEKLLEVHESQPRNMNIAYVFYIAGFIETWGRGINPTSTQAN